MPLKIFQRLEEKALRTASHSNDFKGERLAIVGDITLVYKEDGDNDYSMGFVNPKFWRTYK